MNDFDWKGGLRAVYVVYFVIASAACLAASFTGKLFEGVFPFWSWVVVAVIWILAGSHEPERPVGYVIADEEVPE